MNQWRWCSVAARAIAIIFLLSGSVLFSQRATTPVRVSEPMYRNPVIAGDYPDPSVIRVGQDYWATATSSEWAPYFPLMHSQDLVNWTVVGAVFTKQPEWAESNFWAPEISEYQGRYYVFYTARKIGGSLCVASAVSDVPQGAYTDQGPLVCDDAGSIDGFSIANENGQRYLIWKYDGNSRNVPSVIWAQPMTADAKALIGERTELIRNDSAWEGSVVEGPFILKHEDYYYLFYSGNACCGLQCNYALGVARSKALLGPWQKYDRNPLLRDNPDWRCPGHGSIVAEPGGRTFLLHHAYSRKGSVWVGREAVLDEVTWPIGGWPEIRGSGVILRATAPLGVAQNRPLRSVEDRFSTPVQDPLWEWPNANPPVITLANGLTLAPSANPEHTLAAVIARATISPTYLAETEVTVPAEGMAGISAFGDRQNAIGIGVRLGRYVVWQRHEGTMRIVAAHRAPVSGNVRLRATSTVGNRMYFDYSNDGKFWWRLGPAVSLASIPPWDRSVRIALYNGGTALPATFTYFRMRRQNPTIVRRTTAKANSVVSKNAPASGSSVAPTAIAKSQ